MAYIDALNGETLLDNVQDPDSGDVHSVFELNGVEVSAITPVNGFNPVSLTTGQVFINPASGQVLRDDQDPIVPEGSFTFSVTDGIASSNTETCTVVNTGQTVFPPDQTDPPTNIVTTDVDITFDAPAIANLNGGNFLRMLMMILPEGDYLAGDFSRASYPAVNPGVSNTFDVSNYANIGSSSRHVMRLRTVSDANIGQGRGDYSVEAFAQMQTPASAPNWDTQPSFGAGPFVGGQPVTFSQGAASSGANTVTIALFSFLLGASNRITETQNDNLWPAAQTAGEVGGTIRMVFSATDDVTGLVALSDEITAPLAADPANGSGGGANPDETSVNTQAQLDAAINGGDAKVFLEPGSYSLIRALPTFPNDLEVRGTPASILNVSLTGVEPNRSLTFQGMCFNQTFDSFARGKTLSILDCLFHGPTSFPLGSAELDRMLRAKIDVIGLSSQPVVGAVVSSSSHAADTTVMAVYDWNAANGSCTIAVDDTPAKTTGGTAYGQGNFWASGQNIQITGAGSGTTQSSNYGKDPMMQDGIKFAGGQNINHLWDNVVITGNEMSGWKQALEAKASVSQVIQNNKINGITSDAIKIHFNVLAPAMAVDCRFNESWGVLSDSSYHGNPHADAGQGQMTPVSATHTHTGAILIEENISTARGYIPLGYLQGWVMTRWRYGDITLRKNVHDCGNGTLGISCEASQSGVVEQNTIISSVQGAGNGGVRNGGVFIKPGGIPTSNNICEIFDGTPGATDLLLGKWGGSGAAQYIATMSGGAEPTLTGDMIADTVAWLTPLAGVSEGALNQSGNFR